MKNADMPAMPVVIPSDVIIQPTYGLTKRETMAMYFMAAWIQHHGSSNDYGFSSKDAALSAIDCADVLIEELEK